MLTGKQKRYLRGIGHNLNAIFQIGKEGVHQSQIDGIEDALNAHELIKIKILESCLQSKNEIAIELSMRTHADVVQILGRTILLYRPSEKQIYSLPK
ncbi:ribosome assembly RNA-binding protein YhbY [uncultured Thomasclavelia sp.]|uniref:ribosome assembly RNA-binding protein YhbY n=1 Tax=uncultured Thomasclavelia sp. TaxID=3025759 RepID=UPI0025E103B3|nr:ribosome assembly RNA-binding protein YhbY [uncultured Thomasclavelia sp.]